MNVIASVPDFMLGPRSRTVLHFSGLLRGGQWLHNSPEERSTRDYLVCVCVCVCVYVYIYTHTHIYGAAVVNDTTTDNTNTTTTTTSTTATATAVRNNKFKTEMKDNNVCNK